MFQSEVPEIGDKIVEVKSLSRDPGIRTKIAVVSNDSDVDPVGACVGMRGVRVQNIIQELRGEKIDIVPWSQDPAKFACNALSPSRVSKVIIDEDNKSMEVIVDDDQLSLAIGRRGQNVRLASKLTEWNIDIKTESQVKQEQKEIVSLLMSLPNVSEVTANLLYSEGFQTLEDIAFCDPELLTKTASFKSEEDAIKVQTGARYILKNRLEKMTVPDEKDKTEKNNKEQVTQ